MSSPKLLEWMLKKIESIRPMLINYIVHKYSMILQYFIRYSSHSVFFASEASSLK